MSSCSAYLDLPSGRWHCHIDANHEGLHYNSNYNQAFGFVAERRKGPKDEGEVGNLRQYAVETIQAHRVMTLVDGWFNEFLKKNQDYQTSTGNVSENFGLMGQYMKLTDKIHKLRTPMWDDEILRQAGKEGVVKELNFEGAEEILRDIIGHCFLALDFMEQRDER